MLLVILTSAFTGVDTAADGMHHGLLYITFRIMSISGNLSSIFFNIGLHSHAYIIIICLYIMSYLKGSG